MKVKLLRNIGIGGVKHKIGDVVEVSRILGLEMIGGNRAELVEGEGLPTGGVISTENGVEPFPAEETEPEPAKPKGRGK